MGETNENPFAVYDIAAKIKECIEPFLAGTTTGMPGRSCVTAGDIAWDDCECGQLIVSMQNNAEVNSPGEPRESATAPGRRACGPSLFRASFLVSMLRCAPSGRNGAPPTCEQLDAAARVAAEDAWAVRAGVICCLASAIKDRLPNGTRLYRDFVVGQQTFVGPDGMCQGSEMPVSVYIDNGCYPCDQS